VDGTEYTALTGGPRSTVALSKCGVAKERRAAGPSYLHSPGWHPGRRESSSLPWDRGRDRRARRARWRSGSSITLKPFSETPTPGYAPARVRPPMGRCRAKGRCRATVATSDWPMNMTRSSVLLRRGRARFGTEGVDESRTGVSTPLRGHPPCARTNQRHVQELVVTRLTLWKLGAVLAECLAVVRADKNHGSGPSDRGARTVSTMAPERLVDRGTSPRYLSNDVAPGAFVRVVWLDEVSVDERGARRETPPVASFSSVGVITRLPSA
jgi:hypothetical protein